MLFYYHLRAAMQQRVHRRSITSALPTIALIGYFNLIYLVSAIFGLATCDLWLYFAEGDSLAVGRMREDIVGWLSIPLAYYVNATGCLIAAINPSIKRLYLFRVLVIAFAGCSILATNRVGSMGIAADAMIVGTELTLDVLIWKRMPLGKEACREIERVHTN